MTFKNCRTKKVHMFLFHYGGKNQIGGKRPDRSALPLNVLKRGSKHTIQLIFLNIKIFTIFIKVMF